MAKKNNRKKRKIVSRTLSKRIIYRDDAPVFKFIDPNNNDKLSEMSGLDLQDLMILIDDYYIKLRNQLGFGDDITFGFEIEFEHAMRTTIYDRLYNIFPNETWIMVGDGSLEAGAEINSPILKDKIKTWEDLNRVCSIVEPLAYINDRSGGHIHVGTQTLGDNRDSWLNFIKIWSVYENIIFRFTYGNYLTARPVMQRYSEPMTKDFWRFYEKLKSTNADLNTIINTISNTKYQAVNFNNVSRKKCSSYKPNNTIEFRCPNGSLDPAIWQNNVNLFVNLLCYSKSSSFNDDIVEKRHQINNDRFSSLGYYDEIYLDQALELCDMVFSNNFDKVYFLRQYLKSFKVRNDNSYKKSLKFTKKGIKKVV